jgi:hypothetical protein
MAWSESIEKSLAILRGEKLPAAREVLPSVRRVVNPPPGPSGFRHVAAPLPNDLPRRADLLRICALHGRPWAAVYMLDYDKYEYSSSIQITQTLYRTQYGPGCQETVVWDSRWITEETCPWCGVTSKPFRCGKCKQLSGGCMSTGMYFRCFCGAEGMAELLAFEHVGFIPKIRP